MLVAGSHPRHSLLGIVWLALTAAAMFALAAGKRATGRALDNRVLETEARVTMIDGLLATAVLIGLSERRLRLVVGRSGGGVRDRLLRRCARAGTRCTRRRCSSSLAPPSGDIREPWLDPSVRHENEPCSGDVPASGAPSRPCSSSGTSVEVPP